VGAVRSATVGYALVALGVAAPLASLIAIPPDDYGIASVIEQLAWAVFAIPLVVLAAFAGWAGFSRLSGRPSGRTAGVVAPVMLLLPTGYILVAWIINPSPAAGEDVDPWRARMLMGAFVIAALAANAIVAQIRLRRSGGDAPPPVVRLPSDGDGRSPSAT
jgi:hypothetical protein